MSASIVCSLALKAETQFKTNSLPSFFLDLVFKPLVFNEAVKTVKMYESQNFVKIVTRRFK